MAPVGWGKAALLAIPWAIAVTICDILLWVFGPSVFPTGFYVCLLAPVCLMAVLSGFVHRSRRVGLLAGLLVIAFSVLAFLILVVLALSIHVNP